MAEGDGVLYNAFKEDVMEGIHQLQSGGHTIQVTLHDGYTPDIDTHVIWGTAGVSSPRRDDAVELMRKIPRRARDVLTLARDLQAACDQLEAQIQEAKRLVDLVIDRAATLAQLARTSEHWVTGEDHWDDDESDDDGGERES